MVHVTRQGEVYAFIVGIGLVRATDPGVNWELVSKGVGQGFPLHMAVDAAAGQNLYAVTFHPKTRTQALLMSRDKGKTWAPLGENK